MTMDRRMLLAAGGAALAATIARPHVVRAATALTLPPLPYPEDALAPTISARTVGLHYGKHHKAYYDKLASLTKDTPYADLSLEETVKRSKAEARWDIFNNAGQALNHNHYWEQFKGGKEAPAGDFAAAIERDFGSLDQMKAKFAAEADKVFGTGWAWLVKDGGKLAVIGLKDAGTPLAEGKVALAGIDVWEHAYYLDYENRKADHVKAVLNERINWRFVGEKFKG